MATTPTTRPACEKQPVTRLLKAARTLTASKGDVSASAHPNKGLPPPSPGTFSPNFYIMCTSCFLILHAAFKGRCRQAPQAGGSGSARAPVSSWSSWGRALPSAHARWTPQHIPPLHGPSLKQAKRRPLHSGQAREARGLRGTRPYLPSGKTRSLCLDELMETGPADFSARLACRGHGLSTASLEAQCW